jgi:hypothetical protein
MSLFPNVQMTGFKKGVMNASKIARYLSRCDVGEGQV